MQNAKQTNSGLKHALEASLEEFRLPEVGRQDGNEAAAACQRPCPCRARGQGSGVRQIHILLTVQMSSIATCWSGV